MTDLHPLFPRQQVPALDVPLVSGGRFNLVAERPERFTLLVFYRGLHCPICRAQLKELESKLPEFQKRGVSVVAISFDSQDRAGRAKSEWGLPNLRLGYGLDLGTARGWGLYVSTSRGTT
jgi:peroxiredoxin